MATRLRSYNADQKENRNACKVYLELNFLNTVQFGRAIQINYEEIDDSRTA